MEDFFITYKQMSLYVDHQLDLFVYTYKAI